MQRHAGNATSPTAGQVVLHADDLGFNRAVTDGILHGFRCGLLTSTSLLANAPDAARALDEWQQLLDEQATGFLPSADVRRRLGDPATAFDLGIHLNLTQGRPLSGAAYPAELLDRDGRFPGVWTLFRRLRRPRPDWLAAVKAELARQIELVLDHGLRPTHVNGHQYIEMLPAVAAMLPELLERYAIRVVRVAAERSLFRTTVLRNLAVPQWLLAQVKRWHALRFGRCMDAVGIAHTDAFFGTAHAGRIDLRLMRVFLRSAAVPAAEGGQDARAPGWAHDRDRLAPRLCATGRIGGQRCRRLARSAGCAPPRRIAVAALAGTGRRDPVAAIASGAFERVGRHNSRSRTAFPGRRCRLGNVDLQASPGRQPGDDGNRT